MPDKTTAAGELPPLPEPNSYCTHADSHEYDVFDADQMRAYATAALAQKDGEIERLRAFAKKVCEINENGLYREEIVFEGSGRYAVDIDAVDELGRLCAALGSQA